MIYKQNKMNNKLFKNLTEADKLYIEKIYKDKSIKWDDRMSILTKNYNISERAVRKWAIKLGLKERIEVISEQIEIAKKKDFNKDKKVFLISCAQNATKINKNLIKGMESYANFRDAEILIIPIRYHNSSVISSETDKKQEWWDADIVKYLSLKRHKLNNNITVLSDIKTQPTAVNPLIGFESIGDDTSSIIAHPRIHMTSLPVLNSAPKMLFTTGICTKRNYTDSKAGKIGEFHHTYGFVVVEIEDNETFYIRQVTATDEGNFNDLYYNVTNGVVTENDGVAALIKGDIHYGSHDEKVFDVSFNELIPKLKPKEIFLHDVFDGKSINHHEENNFISNYLKEVKNENSLKKEINDLLDWLDKIKHLNLVIVFSNHDDFLNRYIINKDFKKDIKNAMEYMDYSKVLMEEKAPNGLIAYIISQKFPNIKCLGRNDSYKVKGWELAVHGMDGANGSKGSISQYKKLNTHIVTAHTHSPRRMDGAIQVGTNSLLKLDYNNGMSSWVHCDVIIHNDKKAQHIFYIGKNKEFTNIKK